MCEVSRLCVSLTVILFPPHQEHPQLGRVCSGHWESSRGQTSQPPALLAVTFLIYPTETIRSTSPEMAYNSIDLQQIARYFSSKRFIWEEQRIAIEDIWSKDKPHTSPEKHKPLWSWKWLLQRKLSSKCSDFSLAEIGHLPLGELLGQEESFLPPAEVAMHITYCRRCKILLFLLRSEVCVE